MRAIVHGTQEIDFRNDSGDQIQGLRLYIGYQDEHVAGQKTDRLFLKKGFTIPKELVPNAVVDLSFDINKRLDRLQVISTPATK